MGDCCSQAGCEIAQLEGRQSRVLVFVLAINALMFVVELTAGILASSTALMADSLDMLGDALVYAFSLYVVSRGDLWKARSAFLKGAIMAGFGLFVLVQAVLRAVHPVTPEFQTISLFGALALVANSISLALLWRHRSDDVNMRGVWLCSRNDIAANTSVIVAGAGVWATSSQWPDLVIGLGIAALFLRSAVTVLGDALRVRRAALVGGAEEHHHGRDREPEGEEQHQAGEGHAAHGHGAVAAG